MKRAHFQVQVAPDRGLHGNPCRCRIGADHLPDGRPAVFAQPLPTGRRVVGR